MAKELGFVKAGETVTMIIVVDDEPEQSLLTPLVRPVYQVCAANSGEKAQRAAARKSRPYLILRDIMMPGDKTLRSKLRRINTALQAAGFRTKVRGIEPEEIDSFRGST